MADYLKMETKQAVFTLLKLNWSYRRIERELGVRRETISKYRQETDSKAAKVAPETLSPAIDAGNNTALSPDYAGIPRPQRPAYDIGAHECCSGSVSTLRNVYLPLVVR